MVAEFQLFKPRTYADASDWKIDLKAKVDAFGELEKAGADKIDDLQLFLSEVVWSVILGELTAARAVEFLSKTPIPAREPLQRIFADVLWLVGFGATEAPPDRALRDDFHAFCASLEKEGVLTRPVLALSLETESVPPAVCQVMMLKKKHNQAKTKARYTITRYNLLREHSEGYAKLIVLLERLASLSFDPEASPEQLQQSRDSLVEDVVRLAGFGHLCPNRILSMSLDIYEKKVADGERDPLAQPLLSLMQRLPRKRLTEVVVFQLLAHQPPPSGRDARPLQPHPPPSRPSQFLAVASLISAGLIDLDTLWSYLDPTDASVKQAYADLMSKYDDEVSSVTKVDLGSSSSSSKDRNSFGRAFQAFNQLGHQKFRLVAALISVNSWRHANRALLHLQRICKPCLNHHVRSALCDLLKWMIMPILRPLQKRTPQQTKASLESSYACARRFSLGLAGEANGAMKQATDVEQLLPQLRQVLEHLEYFLHTDMHLLVSLWRVLQLYLKQREKAAGGGTVVLDDALVAVIYRHLLPAASLVPHNPQLSDLMWGVMSQLSVFQRFLIYSCWEITYDNFLLKFAYEKTKAATKQILKRVVANAERRDLIAHQSHFHFCKLCHSNPIPAIETMLRDVEIGFNVNMIQPYVECTTRCPEMTADVMGYVLTRCCAKPTTPNRVFLSQADATLSPWLVNLGEFVGRFYKKHPHTDLHGLLSIITRRINNEAVESNPGGPPMSIQVEYKGESLIRVILEALIEYMGGYVTVADMNAEQLHCLAGGPRLKSESITVGKKEENSRKERARQPLFTALVDLGLVPVLWYSLAQQRHHFLSEEFSEAHGGAGGLKLLGLLFDGNHDCLLKLIEFLAQACTREKYMTLMPSLQEVFTTLEPALAFLAARHGLTPYGRAPLPPLPVETAAPAGTAPAEEAAPTAGAAVTTEKGGAGGEAPAGAATPAPAAGAAPAAAATTPAAAMPAPAASAPAVDSGAAPSPDGAGGTNGSGTNGSSAAAEAAMAEEEKTCAELEKVVRSYLPSIESDGLSMQFYITFWRLSLQDIFTPIEGYEKAIQQISTGVKQIEVQRKLMDRERDSTHSRDYRSLKKESARLQDFYSKLKEEQLAQQYNHQKVLARLKREKTQWFIAAGPLATSTFVSEMICPRVLTSYSDALFCCHFVRLLIKLKTPGFHLLDFYNCWTVMLTQCIRCCSEREAQIFGVFLREMMSYILTIRRDEATFQSEVKENPCFHRAYYTKKCFEDPNSNPVEFAQMNDVRRGHSKWEGRIYKAMRQGLEAEDWMEKRNALLLLSQCYESFPVVEKYARLVLGSVEALRETEELSDLKTLANSLVVKLKSRRDHWVDKGVQESTSSRDHGRRGTEESRRAKNPLAPQADGNSSANQKHSEGRSPRRGSADGKRMAPPLEQDGATSERRSRREDEAAHGGERQEAKADTVASQGGERSGKESRDPKDHKESREVKEKTRDRAEAKAPKEMRESKEVRSSDKVPKESRDGKEASRVAEKDGKRLTTERPREKEPAERQLRSDKDREREKVAERLPKSASEKDMQGSDRKRSGAGSSNPAPSPSHPPAHADERDQKRRRTDRDGDAGHAAPAIGSSRGGSTGDRSTSDRHGYGSGGGHQPRNALTSAPEPAGSSSQYYRSAPTSGRGHDYRSSGYTGHASGHSGGRYDQHRRR